MRGGGASPAKGGDASENEFTLGELIGEGGFGRVYECLMDDGRICAAKVVPILRGRDHRTREAAQKEIEGEVQLMQRLTHPNIVAYFGTKTDEKSLYIFMELVPAGSIASMLSKYGKFREPIIRGYTREILQGLGYLHDNQILHRDIKGQNILVDHAGVCKLADFGCSKDLFGAVAAVAQTLKGTPRFMAPEVLRNHGKHGKGYTAKADVWSVGCTIVEMATGERPWPEFMENEAVMYHVGSGGGFGGGGGARPPAPAWVSDECKDLLSRCFERDPEARASVKELLLLPMVAAAKLRDDQRLGGRSADPSEISLELSSSLPVPAKAEPSIRLAGGVSARLEMYEEEEAPDDAGASPGAGAGAGVGAGVGADVAGRVEKEEEEEEEEDGESESDGGGRTPPSVGKSAQFLTSTLHSAGTVGSTISSAGSIVPPSGVGGRGRDVPASVKQDAEGCLQLIEHSNKAVQTVRASRDKCFSLAQRMRRAKIPLERLVSGRLDLSQRQVEESTLRHAIMDLRDCLENCSEVTRKHGYGRIASRIRSWAFSQSIKGEFEACEKAIAKSTAVLEELTSVSDASAPQEPDMWSRRVLKGTGAKIRCVALVGRSLWCGSKGTIRVIDADGRRVMQRLEIKAGSVKSILQIASDGSMLTATSVRENMSARKVWTGHSDGRVCVWRSGDDRGGKTSAGATVTLEREFTVEGGVGVLSMVQIGSNVWLGTSGGSVYVCDADGDGRRGGMKVVSSRGEARTHLGGVRSLLVVGTEVWSASDGGDVNVWKEREREHVRAVHSSAGRVRVMARSPDGGVLTGHQSGIIQLWSADGLLRASASTMSSVASLVQGGGFVWTGHTDGTLRIWSAGSEGIAMVRSVHGHNKAVLGIVKDAASVWTVSSNGTVREWSINLLLLERSIDSGVVTINSAPQAESVSHASLAGSLMSAPSAPTAKIGGRSRIMIALGRILPSRKSRTSAKGYEQSSVQKHASSLDAASHVDNGVSAVQQPGALLVGEAQIDKGGSVDEYAPLTPAGTHSTAVWEARSRGANATGSKAEMAQAALEEGWGSKGGQQKDGRGETQAGGDHKHQSKHEHAMYSRPKPPGGAKDIEDEGLLKSTAAATAPPLAHDPSSGASAPAPSRPLPKLPPLTGKHQRAAGSEADTSKVPPPPSWWAAVGGKAGVVEEDVAGERQGAQSEVPADSEPKEEVAKGELEMQRQQQQQQQQQQQGGGAEEAGARVHVGQVESGVHGVDDTESNQEQLRDGAQGDAKPINTMTSAAIVPAKRPGNGFAGLEYEEEEPDD